VESQLKKKAKSPVNALAVALVGDKQARRLKQSNADAMIDSVTVKPKALRFVTPKS